MNWPLLIRDAARASGHTLDLDVVEELAAHAQAAFDAAYARGSSVDEAEAQTRALIAAWIAEAPVLRREPPRSQAPLEPAHAGSRHFGGLANDFRYAARLLVRQRGFAVLAILTMALTIGVMTTLCSVVYGVLLTPLPWPEPDRLVRLTETHVGATRQMPLMMSNIGYLPWIEQPTTIDTVGAWLKTSVTLTGAGNSDRVPIAAITASVFPLLRARPLLGQVFTSDEASEVVLSFGFWQERSGGNRAMLGEILQLNGKPFVVVAVMPREFMFPDRDTRLWRPLVIPPVVGKDGVSRSISTFSAMARLKPGVTPAQAAAEATARARTAPDAGHAALAMFGTTGPAEISAEPVLEALTHDVKQGLVALFAAVSLLLLAAVSNIAGLQLARATTRYRELAIRSAIGAITFRLVRQLLIENIVLAAIAGAVGVLLSAGLHRALPSILPADFPRLDSIAFSGVVASFALVVTALTGLAVGLLPALHLRGLRLVDGLTENSNGAIGGTRARARTVMMTGQVAIASALLVGAMLLTRSFVAMAAHDRGFDPANVLTARLTLPDFAFAPQARLDALDAFLERARALPGTPAVALTTGLPLSNSENVSGFTMPSVQPPAGTEIQVHAVRSVVTAEFFKALGFRIVQGRGFQPQDDSASAPKIVLVNRTFAKQYLTTTAVGDHIRNFMRGDGVDFEVVGVVDDVLRRGLTDATQPEIYSLLHQSTGPSAAHDVVLRTSDDPTVLIQPLRALVKELSPSATVDSVRTMDARIAGSLARPRLYAVLLAVFAISALVIASVGLFGVLSFTVAQRTREIALRSALGASPAQIFGLVFARGASVTLAGLVLGLLLALSANRYLASLLYGISTYDAVTFLAVSGLIMAVAFVACVVPALRAIRVDPLTALRA